MNFDLNMLSTLMQLMGKQPGGETPRQTEPNTQTGQRVATSSFVRENGIGEKVRIEADRTPSQTSSSPIAGILELMGGKSGGTDGMSALMPMLMGLLSKGGQGGDRNPSTCGNKETPASYGTPQNGRGGFSDDRSDYAQQDNSEMSKSKQRHDKTTFNDTRSLSPQGMYAPISYAGYSLISALNLLYRHVYG